MGKTLPGVSQCGFCFRMAPAGPEHDHQGVVDARISVAPARHGPAGVGFGRGEVAEFVRDQGEGLIHRLEVGRHVRETLVDAASIREASQTYGQGAGRDEEVAVPVVAFEGPAGEGVGLLGVSTLGEYDDAPGDHRRRGPGIARSSTGSVGRGFRRVEPNEGRRHLDELQRLVEDLARAHDVLAAARTVAREHACASAQQEVARIAGQPKGPFGFGHGRLRSAHAQIGLGEVRRGVRVVGSPCARPFGPAQPGGEVTATRHDQGRRDEASNRPANHRTRPWSFLHTPSPRESTIRSWMLDSSAAGGT